MNGTEEGAVVPKALTVERLQQAVVAIQAAHARRQERVQRLQETAMRLKRVYAAHSSDARQELSVALATHARVGWPPSFIQVAGQSHLEKPFNRLIAWLCQQEGHGLGSLFLQRLSRTVGLESMASDLASGERPEMWFEQSFSEDTSKEPDVVIRTRRAALLLENKVYASESGDQYGPYQRLFEKAAGDREKRLLLCSRKPRETPPGWVLLLHAQLASILRDLAQDDSLSFWSRVNAIISATAFEDGTSPYELIREANDLLAATALRPADVARMRELRRKMNAMNAPMVEMRRHP
jgi:hypothetical protein